MISIHAAGLADIPAVRDLAHRIWHAHYPGIIGVDQIDYMLERGYATASLAAFVDSRGAGLAVARDEGVPVGFAAWCRAGIAGTTKLDKLYVLQAWQRHGIGGRLIRHVESAARADGASVLVLNVNRRNAGAIAAYERYGFARREAVVVDIGNGFVMDDDVMAKPL